MWSGIVFPSFGQKRVGHRSSPSRPTSLTNGLGYRREVPPWLGYSDPVTHNEKLSSVYAALDQADEVVEQLHAGCCEPLRSPRMETLAATLESARSKLEGIDENNEGGAMAITILEDAGALLGYLQVGCCAPGRTKLYAEALQSLTKAQRGIHRSLASTDHSSEHH